MIPQGIMLSGKKSQFPKSYIQYNSVYVSSYSDNFLEREQPGEGCPIVGRCGYKRAARDSDEAAVLSPGRLASGGGHKNLHT